MSNFFRYVDSALFSRIRKKIAPNFVYLVTKTSVRRCGCCDKISIFLQFGEHSYAQYCLQCAAMLRYEMLGRFLRQNFPPAGRDILELDPNSSLRHLLKSAHTYIRSYYREGDAPGVPRQDGAIMQDITRLTIPDCSLDMIVSSDVLEHVPDVDAAFRESYRVLKPGGVHVFTIPNQSTTTKLAELRDGQIHHLVPSPEYHSDPLDPKGILAFWHFGPDIQGNLSKQKFC